MRSLSLARTSLAALCATLLLNACGGTEPEVTTPTAPSPSGAGEAQATNLTSCNPQYYCRVSSSTVRCANGIYMDSFWTTDGWCIEADICARHGGPIICPLRPE
jgi:hypothetical protein